MKYIAIIAVAMLCLGCPAVGSLIPVLTEVIADVTDGMQILDQIAEFIDRYFKAKPDPVLEEKVRRSLGVARSSLNLALRAARGAKELDQQQVDAAFQDFEVAYQELMALLGPLGVHPKGTLSATKGENLEVPEPLALRRRVQ